VAKNILRFISIMLLAVALGGGFAHLFELLNKMPLSRDDYLTVQQIYRGWALLGIPIFGALIATFWLAALERRRRRPFGLTLAAALCILASLVVFFTFTFPANQATANWTFLPGNWEELRRRWEYSHAVGALLYYVALGLLTLSLLVDRPRVANGRD
jgi:hypothetical protein